MITFDESLPAPLENEVTLDGDTVVTADWCHPPMPITDRGQFFDGSSNSLLLHDFEIYRTFTISMTARISNTDASLFSAQVALFSDAGDDGRGIEGILDLFLSSCNAIVFDFGPDRVQSAEELDVDVWRQVTVLGEGVNTPGEMATTLTLLIDDVEEDTFDSNYVIWPDSDPNFHIGSYKGLLYFSHGYVKDFIYSIEADGTRAEVATGLGECNWW